MQACPTKYSSFYSKIFRSGILPLFRQLTLGGTNSDCSVTLRMRDPCAHRTSPRPTVGPNLPSGMGSPCGRSPREKRKRPVYPERVRQGRPQLCFLACETGGRWSVAAAPLQLTAAS